jgi:uncharacterized membrane protein
MTRRMLLAALALIGLLIAVYLTLYKVGVIGQLACTIGSCETVNTSRWATFLGLPVAAWGIVFYVVALALALASLQERFEESRALVGAIVAWCGWGVLFSGWLTYLELFVIHAICIWCVTSAVVVAVMFVVSLIEMRAARA